MTLTAPENVNYAATIVAVPEPVALPGLDNLVGIPLYGYQALTQKADIAAGDLRVLFTAETRLDTEYARENNLFRDTLLNKDAGETGYLENNARVKAIRLRKNNSNALLMPLSSLAYTGYDVSTLQPGDTFDTLNGHAICRKYVPRGAAGRGATQRQGPKVRQRIDQKQFPMHLDTEHLFRNLHVFHADRHVVVTQKLHGTSWRGGRVPALRRKSWLERVVVNKWLRIATPDTAHEDVFGSRRVIKGRDDNNHYYDSDVWTEFGKRVEGKIPENFIVYGELVGWVDTDTPIQKGYTYDLLPGQNELYVYRVATVNSAGVIADLSWAGVKEFCAAAGLKHAPEIEAGTVIAESDDAVMIDEWSRQYLDQKLADTYRQALPLSNPKSVDEGICVRIEGMVPRIFKAKSPIFLEHETRLLDTGDVDVETAA
ncbi:MAG: hypothetical protein CK431_04470 [Mycobacterium sp.]|nr:MAG: hypothetical protein CK431_04470 [Mycobacterium sp.]